MCRHLTEYLILGLKLTTCNRMHSSCYRAAAFRIDNRRYWNKEDKIENKLSSWFYLAEKSKAILLIDEADIFLERRKHTDLARNRIVSGKCHPHSMDTELR